MGNAGEVGSEVGMKDPYEKVWKSIGEVLSTQSKMVFWIAERTLSAKEFQEFIDEFAKKPEDNHDELLKILNQRERVKSNK